MGALNITFPGTVESISSRSNFDGGTATTPGFAGLAGGSDDVTLTTDLSVDVGLADVYMAPTEIGIPISKQITFGFDENTAVFSLDGAPAISFNDLPAGFVITSLGFSIATVSNIAGIVIHVKINGSDIINSPSNDAFTIYTLTFPDMPLSSTDFIGTQIQIAFTGTPTIDNVVQLFIESYVLSGTFTTQSFVFSWTLESDGPVEGDVTPITLSSNPLDDHALDLKNLDLTLDYDDGGPISVPITNILEQDDNLFIFLVPIFPITVYKITITATDPTGKQFTGSIPLGTLPTINLTDPSGIYRLVDGKTNDTLYIQNDPPNTIDVKIPNPFIKTAFIP